MTKNEPSDPSQKVYVKSVQKREGDECETGRVNELRHLVSDRSRHLGQKLAAGLTLSAGSRDQMISLVLVLFKTLFHFFDAVSR